MARAAFETWGRLTLAKRMEVLFTFRELLNANKQELAEIITSEHGKVVSPLGEAGRGQEVVEFACGNAHLLKGAYPAGHHRRGRLQLRQPLGVVGIISPFNFPAMVPMWFFPIAIAAGNTVILKPSEKDPSAAMFLADLWKQAGLPDGVFNVVHGDKVAVDTLLTHPDVASISFVGSTPIAQYVYETGPRTASGCRLSVARTTCRATGRRPRTHRGLGSQRRLRFGRALHGDLGDRGCGAGRRRPHQGDRNPHGGIADRRRPPGCDMGPLVTAVHRTRSPAM